MNKQNKIKQATEVSQSDSNKLLGGDAINIYYDTGGGAVKKIPFKGNVVLVHLFPDVDYEGKQVFKRIVTIALKDQKMLEPLKEEAYRILGA